MPWFLPTHGDGRHLGSQVGARHIRLDYLGQISRAADELGYHSMLLPTGRSCEDSWVVASATIPQTRRARFLVAVRPGLSEPSMTARMAATFDRLSGGRLLVNVVTGGDPVKPAGDGVFLDRVERYAAAAQHLQVWRRLMRGETVDHEGRHVRNRGGHLLHPPFCFGGSSKAGQRVAAEQCDVRLACGEPPAAVGGKIEAVRALAAAHRRTLSFGIRLHVIVRNTSEAAWRAGGTAIG